MATYTIGETAERSGFTASALRFYEQHGVIEPVGRTPGGYRLYDDDSIERLEFVARAKQLGCTLTEITDLVRLWDDDDCGPVQRRLHELVTSRIADARARRAELRILTEQLETAAAHLGADPTDGPCRAGCACVSAAAEPVGPVRVELGVRADPAIACTLSADDLPSRIEAWRSVLDEATGRARLPDAGLRVTFGPGLALSDLAGLVAAEQTCCSFFSFAITVDDRGTALEVRAPTDAAAVVDALFGEAD